MKQLDLNFGVLTCANGVVTKGFTFYAPMKNSTLMQFCVTAVEYSGEDMLCVKFFAENNKGETMGFQYYLGIIETLPYRQNIKLYDSVDDFIDNKPITFFLEKRNVSFIAPYKSVNFEWYQTTRLIAYANYYRITDAGVKLNCGGRLADFNLVVDMRGNLWGKFIEDFSDNMYDSEIAAKRVLRERLVVEPLEKQTKSVPQVSITINICPSDSDEDILNKIKASFIE